MYTVLIQRNLSNNISKTYHERVNAGIDEDEHPDWRRHIPDACPSREHSTGVVENLHPCCTFTLGENQGGVQGFIIF